MDADASITGVLDEYIQPDDEFILSREGNYIYHCVIYHCVIKLKTYILYVCLYIYYACTDILYNIINNY